MSVREGSNQRGIILISTMFAIGLMSVLLIGLIMILLTDLQITKNDRDTKKSIWAARAGIEMAISNLQTNSAWAAGFTNQAGPTGSGYIYTVTVVNAYPFVTLTSIGQPGGILSKTIRAKIMVMGPPAVAPYRIRVDSWEML